MPLIYSDVLTARSHCLVNKTITFPAPSHRPRSCTHTLSCYCKCFVYDDDDDDDDTIYLHSIELCEVYMLIVIYHTMVGVHVIVIIDCQKAFCSPLNFSIENFCSKCNHRSDFSSACCCVNEWVSNKYVTMRRGSVYFHAQNGSHLASYFIPTTYWHL